MIWVAEKERKKKAASKAASDKSGLSTDAPSGRKADDGRIQSITERYAQKEASVISFVRWALVCTFYISGPSA